VDLYAKGLEGAQSIAVNLGKWFFTGMCLAMFWVEDRATYKSTLEINPAYLRNNKSNSKEDEVINYKDWTISTRRRFNSLRVWYVLRSLGLKKLRNNVHQNCKVASILEEKVKNHPRLELLCRRELCIVCFRIVKDKDGNRYPEDKLNEINAHFRDKIVESGDFYLVEGEVSKIHFIRFIVNNPDTGEAVMQKFWEHLIKIIKEI